MKKNPMLHAGFTFASLTCEPLVPEILKALGLDGRPRDFHSSDGGPAAEVMMTNSMGYEEVFVFSATDMTEEKWADRLMMFAGLSKMDHVIVVAPAFSDTFMRDMGNRREAPVHFVVAQDGDPLFRQITVGEGGPFLDKTVCPECHLDRFFHRSGAEMCPEGDRRSRYDHYLKELQVARGGLAGLKDEPEMYQEALDWIENLEKGVERYDPSIPDPEDVPEASPQELLEVEDLLDCLNPKNEEK